MDEYFDDLVYAIYAPRHKGQLPAIRVGKHNRWTRGAIAAFVAGLSSGTEVSRGR